MKLLLSVTTDTCSKAQQRENAPKTAIGVAQRHYAKVDKIILDATNLHLTTWLFDHHQSIKEAMHPVMLLLFFVIWNLTLSLQNVLRKRDIPLSNIESHSSMWLITNFSLRFPLPASNVSFKRSKTSTGFGNHIIIIDVKEDGENTLSCDYLWKEVKVFPKSLVQDCSWS